MTVFHLADLHSNNQHVEQRWRVQEEEGHVQIHKGRGVIPSGEDAALPEGDDPSFSYRGRGTCVHGSRYRVSDR